MMIGKVTFKTKGKLPFIINLLYLHEIEIFRLVQSEDYCTFSVKKKEEKKVKTVLEEHGKEYVVLCDGSVSAACKNNAGRWGLFVGIAVVIALLWLWSCCITTTKIQGNNLVSDEVILNTIWKENKRASLKNNFDAKGIESRLIAIKGISNASLEIKGNVLFVNILEELDEPKTIDYTKKHDIISQYDGVVKRVVALKGTPLVQEGDVVKKGDVLLSSTVEKENGEIEEVYALGSVYGTIWITKEFVFTDTIIKRERTGKVKTFYCLPDSDSEIQSPYPLFEREVELVSAGKVFPIKLKKISFFETLEKEEKFDYYSKKEEIVQKGTEELEKQIPVDVEKVKTWFIEKTVDKKVFLVIYYELVINLADG